MAEITAAMVKELREKTAAGMMDCKAALNETNGDMEAAIDWLRKKGLAKAAKKAGRIAAEGLIGIDQGDKTAAVVEINSETDFVSRNDQFQGFVRDVATLALVNGDSVEALESARFPGANDITVKDKLNELIGSIGENMTLRRVARLSVPAGVVATYIHGSVGVGLGRIGVLVALESKGSLEKLNELGRSVAMHIAAMNPLAIDASGLDPATLEREKAILLEKHQGKPANVQEKILESGLRSYYKEVTLLDQLYVHDGSRTVAQTLKEAEGGVGAPVKITGMVRFALGEGVEKEESDFAAEVAAAAGTR